MPALMFRMLTDGFPFALTGRKWMADGAVFCYVAVLVSVASAGAWLADHPATFACSLRSRPWLVVVRRGPESRCCRGRVSLGDSPKAY